MGLVEYLVNLPVDVFLPGEERRALAKILGIQGRRFLVSAPARSNRVFWPRQGSSIQLVFPSINPCQIEGKIAERRLLPVPLLEVEAAGETPLAQLLATPGRSGRICVITGGKGGTGKTCVSINLAFLCAQKGARVALLDCDWGTANIAIHLGLNPERNLVDIIKGKLDLGDVSLELGDNIHFYPGNSADPETVDLSPWDHARFMGLLAALERMYDYVFIDTGAGLGRAISNCFLTASDIILVLNDTPSSIIDSYGLLKSIRRQTHLPTVSLVMNRVHHGWQGAVNRFLETSRDYLGEKPHFLGAIREDRQILLAECQGRPLVLFAPQSPGAQDLQTLADRFLQLGQRGRG
ncbi:MAG: MinD/ParA family ATP-binding protein [Limnochordia bacterium]|jgi:flagellar biosynthesis protein FlhG